MCGRYALAFVLGLKTRFDVIDIQAKLEPRYNIAPTEMAPVVIRAGVNQVVDMRSGLIPSWAKDMKIGNHLINARGETIQKRPAFRTALNRRRCLVPATGFYEWKETSHGKQPYYIHMKDNSMFAFAGLYEHWKAPDGEKVRSYTILTSEPNEIARELHNRMPVILRREQEAAWIREGPLSNEQLMKVMVPFPAQEMDSHVISSDVNDPRNKDEGLMLPVRMAHDDL